MQWFNKKTSFLYRKTTMYTFISEHIWADVKTIADNKNISELEVLLDPDNPDEYYVNIEQLKQYIGN